MESNSGVALHCYHDELYSYVYDYDERVAYIKSRKPHDEQELRLKLFQLIPDQLLPGQGSPELTAYAKAMKAYGKAWRACRNVLDAFSKAYVAYYKAKFAFYKAEEAYDKAHGKEMETLHKQLCLDCPWDGKTIFTRKNKKGGWY